MNFTKNEAVILTLISCCLMAFGHLTEGTLAYVAIAVGGVILGITINSEQATPNS